MEETAIRTETTEVVEEIPVVEQPAEPEPTPADVVAATEVAAASGAVAIASEAVALSEQTTAAANLQAARTIETAISTLETQQQEWNVWREATAGAMLELVNRQAEMEHQLLTLSNSTKKSEPSPTMLEPEALATNNPNVVAEDPEAPPRRRRHNWI